MAASDPGTHAPTILECLGSEELMRLVTDLVENGDALCAALACTAMRDAIWARAPRAEEAEYTWHVNMSDVALRDRVYSPVFKSGQCRWRLILRAKRSDGVKAAFSIFLEVPDAATLPQGWTRHAEFKLTVHNQKPSGRVTRPCALHPRPEPALPSVA